MAQYASNLEDWLTYLVNNLATLSYSPTGRADMVSDLNAIFVALDTDAAQTKTDLDGN